MTDGTFNARIESADIRLDRGCFLCIWLSLDFGGTHQGFGGYVLDDAADGLGSKRKPTVLCGFYIARLFEVLGVEDFKSLEGLSVRAVRRDGTLVSVGHYLKDQWFEPGAEMRALLGEEASA